jgi:hypothetical protein
MALCGCGGGPGGDPCIGTGTLPIETLELHSNRCLDLIGLDVPAFNCDDGTEVPANHLSAGAYPNQFCDAPNVLNKACDPGSRFQVLAETDEAIVVAHCRKHGRGPGLYGDIAVIQYNKSTGGTCFYQALEDDPPAEHDLPAKVTPPSEGNGPGKFPWLTPADTADIKCVHCHDNGPFIRSPYLLQLGNEPKNRLPGTNDSDNVWGPKIGWNLTQPYRFVGNDFQDWKVFQISLQGTGSECMGCHRMGLGSAKGTYSASWGTSLSLGPMATGPTQPQKNPHSPDSPIWMKPGQTYYDPAVEASALAVQACAEAIVNGGALPPGCQMSQYGQGDTCDPLP